MSITTIHRCLWPLALVGLWCVLLLQTGLAWWMSRHADAGRQARGREWLRSWWQELKWAYRVLIWWLPFRAQDIPDGLKADPEAGAGLTGVVLVHGYLCSRGFWTPWMRRLAAQGRPFVALTLDPPFAPIDMHTSALEAAIQRLRALTGRPPVVVAHSMGGLVFRAWARSAGPDWVHQLGGVVTLATPHQGTWLAHWCPTENGRQMRPDNGWLRALAESESGLARAEVDTWVTLCDEVVFPAKAAQWPGARQHVLRAEGHISMAFAPEVWAQADARLKALDKPPSAVMVS